MGPSKSLLLLPCLVGFWVVLAIVLGGCQTPNSAAANGRRSQPNQPQPNQPQSAAETPVTVDVAIARLGTAERQRDYAGTTQPIRQVSAKARVDGQVLQMTVDGGDRVVKGQVLARIDDRLLRTDLEEAQAEYGARLTEVEEARYELAETQARVAEAKVRLNRARADAARFEELAADGAVPKRRAEVEQTAFAAAQQTVIATEKQVRSRKRAIATAQQRAEAQQAMVERVRERLSYATVTSTLNGVVLDRVTEAGDVVRTGDALLELGDFSQVQVRIDIADRDRPQVAPGQPVTVKLDAFPNREFQGRVVRIFPIADPVARLIPVEIALTDPQGTIGGGLLARVTLSSRSPQRVVIPRSAVTMGDDGEAIVFVIKAGDVAATEAIARPVVLDETVGGDRDQVAVRSGLAPGEAYVVQSAEPLKNGQQIRRSFLSPGFSR